MLSLPLPVDGHNVGALNLYSFGQSFSATDGNLKLREVGQSVAETGTW